LPILAHVTALPAGRHFAITWGIPDGFGGMTTALLHRSRAFVTLGGVEVDVLTFESRPDYASVEADLRRRGELIDGMRLLNLYEWLRENPLPGGSLDLDRHVFSPLQSGTHRYADDGTLLQVDHYRADGTLLLSDRRDTRTPGQLGGRSVVLCDDAGRPVRSWGRIHHLYRAWLDRLTAKQPSYMIVDSKTTAAFMMPYRRRHVTTVHVVHNSHLARADEPFGAVRESRRAVFERLDAFDSVVVLTRRQRDDIVAARGPAANLSVIPNSGEHGLPPAAAPVPAPDPRRGVVLASLTARKRVDHAIRAAATAGVVLDIYGDGELRARLDSLAAAATGVTLHGHRPDARAVLAHTSFLLATGSSEGFPLVLLESMAAGCIPIAYDVPYGPGDIIDGRNGLLVPPGDEVALADAVRRLAAETPAQLARRRRRARRTAERYSDRLITAQWARELRAAARRHARSLAAPPEPAGATAARPAA
jgi:poly(glycerol-phosphate) alpha-glucosyltransferase